MAKLVTVYSPGFLPALRYRAESVAVGLLGFSGVVLSGASRWKPTSGAWAGSDTGTVEDVSAGSWGAKVATVYVLNGIVEVGGEV
jgi:hypothetical protein